MLKFEEMLFFFIQNIFVKKTLNIFNILSILVIKSFIIFAKKI